MGEMTSLERIRAVMRGETPDCLPVVPQSFMFAMGDGGYSIGTANRKPAVMAKCHLECREKYGYDGCIMDVDDSTLAEACGAKVIYREDNVAVVKESEPLLKDLRQIDDLKLPDPKADGRLPEWLETTSRIAEKIGREAMVMGRADQGPFTSLFFLMGMEEACLCSMEEPELFHAIMRMATDYNIAAGLHLLEAGADAVIISEDMGYNSGTFLSPENMRIFILPYIREMTRAFKAHGAKIMLHCDGNMNGILDDLAHSGIDAWQPLERKGKNDLGYVKRTYGDILTPIGNVDSSITLPFGTREDVVNQTLECMRIAGPGGGYILGSDHSLHDGIPVENIYAMVETVKKYGEYPLRLPDEA